MVEEQEKKSEKQSSWRSVWKRPAFWIVLMWLLLIADTIRWMNSDPEDVFAILYYPGLVFQLLFGDIWSSEIHYFSFWGVCIGSGVFYTLIIMLIVYLVRRRRRRRGEGAEISSARGF